MPRHLGPAHRQRGPDPHSGPTSTRGSSRPTRHDIVRDYFADLDGAFPARGPLQHDVLYSHPAYQHTGSSILAGSNSGAAALLAAFERGQGRV